MKLLNDAHLTAWEKLPEVSAKAPGRFHLIGEHSWFFKDKTLSMAVDIYVYIGVSKRDDNTANFYFHQLNDKKKSNLSSLKYKKEDKWANFLKSVIYGFTSGGFNLGGMDITIYSDVLPSAGFGITTAIKTAFAIAIRKLFNLTLSDAELLQVLERGNRRFMSQNNYIADNFSAMFSKKDTLIVTDHQKNSWDYVPFNFEDKKVLIVDTHVPRYAVWNEESIFEPQYALVLGDLRERKSTDYGGWHYIKNVTDINEQLSIMDEAHRRKLLCIMNEHNDLQDAIDGLQKNDFFKFARSVNHSHEDMRDLYEISCPEIDWLLKRVNEIEPMLDMLRNPVSCGRITGKGFGRCLYAVLRESDIEKFTEKLHEFEKIFGFKTDCYIVNPVDGASLLVD